MNFWESWKTSSSALRRRLLREREEGGEMMKFFFKRMNESLFGFFPPILLLFFSSVSREVSVCVFLKLFKRQKKIHHHQVSEMRRRDFFELGAGVCREDSKGWFEN